MRNGQNASLHPPVIPATATAATTTRPIYAASATEPVLSVLQKALFVNEPHYNQPAPSEIERLRQFLSMK
jgi:hypothetical protein